MNAFSITTTTNNVQIESQGRTSVTYTVSNRTGQSLTGRASLETVPANSAHQAWLSLQGERERPFAIGGTQQYIVDVNVPTDAAPGEYTYRLVMVATHNTDETYTPGPTVVATIARQPKLQRRFPLWLIPLIAVAAIGLVAVLNLVLDRPPVEEVPVLPGPDDLEGFEWRLESFLSEAGDRVTVLPDNRPTARFENGEVGGNAGCNSYSGSYQVNGNRLEIGRLSTTLILCSAPELIEQERRYLELLPRAASFLAPDGKLEIIDSGGQTILVYERLLGVELVPRDPSIITELAPES